ncbi:hypothetical protein Ssi03_56750 [Sphaerisporangium siamense]|uniref:Uncharacterized protein n=1 Tax=Sphaerisporangium siamense TaxID=795645 RepID=A0A7W7G970_9ACTN|nr:hypothetical protein [Sphaerisporangium siamense]MBB4700269.1 hypothetical protein [Sphaerisporangium siamense]GII87685.1 hypothetical protein Ssi03_56750 [Sphaerisporangium siamense]
MLLRTEHLRPAADHLEAALQRLRPYGEAGINDLGSLDEQLPQIQKWLADLDLDDFYNSYVEFALVLALALPQDGPVDNSGVERTAEGWVVARGRPVVWFGDAHFDADLTLDGPLIVLGDLTVDGLLCDGDVDHSLFAATGDLRARALRTGAFNLVLGAIEADVIVCFNNDGSLEAGGDITADLFVQDQHSYGLGGDLRLRVPVLDWLPDGSPVEDERTADERLALWLPADYTTLDEDGEVEVDTWRVLTEAAAGRSPVLPTPRS